MVEISIENLTWDYDFKETLLGTNYYDDANPILRFLKAKRGNKKGCPDAYQDEPKHYRSPNYYSNSRGHIEKYKLIEEVFQKLLEGSTDYKDVMNSFWNTYKFSLQLNYPDIFVSINEAKELNLNGNFYLEENRSPSPKRSPTLSIINSNILAYYNNPDNKITLLNSANLVIEEDDTWLDFLINNFDKFNAVHDCPKLKEFAKLTHTIGNIAVVPIGFNNGRNGYDYWDWGLEYLKEFLEPINAWDNYIKVHQYSCYVENFEVKPFWKNHLNRSEDNVNLIPKSKKNIEEYLDFVNKCITSRGKDIIKIINNR